VRESYRQYVQNIPFYGFAVLCLDHPEVRDLAESVTDRKIITYGFADDADVRAENVRVENGVSVFDVIFDDGLILRDMRLPMLGLHNVQNSLAALAIGHRLNFPEAAMREALAEFAGVKRRFTRTGVVDGITVIDDYGHHPIEITAVLKAARMAVSETGGRVLAVMQPHRYSRLSSLFGEFCTCFADADYVFIAPVYAAGETPINGVDHQILAEGVEQSGHHRVAVLAGPEGLPVAINAVAKPGDYVVCLGAGDITKWAYALPGQIENLRGQTKKSGSAA
jgi:UDP-N-acetylmuramate--alanine ligase